MKRMGNVSTVAPAHGLLLAVLIALSVVGSCTDAGSDAADSKTGPPAEAATLSNRNNSVKQAPRVVAYYLHTTQRCISCKKIEAYSREAIETGFRQELTDSILEFRSVNVDEPENKHYIKDYQLYTKSLIISSLKDGQQVRWKNLADVWKLLGSKDDFVAYVQAEIRTCLEER